MERKKCGLIVALDLPALDQARIFLDKLGMATPYVKVGPRLYALGGASFVKEIIGRGYSLFLDIKLHDIPNTVAMAVEPLAEMGLWGLSLHTSGGRDMMERSVKARDRMGSDMKLLGITVLTSLEGDQWDETHPGADIERSLKARAIAAETAGLDGIVCSPLDLSLLEGTAAKLVRVVPGIRRKGARADDQARTASAKEAAGLGAAYIVVGRPILEAEDPVAEAMSTIREISEVL